MTAVDVTAASAFLRARYGGGITEVTAAGSGEWSVAYAFRFGGKDLIARFGSEADDFGKDAFCARFATGSLPIPKVLAIHEALGGYCAISERVIGTYLDDLDAVEFRRALPSLFRAFDAAREAELSSTTGFGMFDATGNAPHATWREALLAPPPVSGRMPEWRARLSTSAAGMAAFDRALARLGELVTFCPEERHLLHGDTINRNVFVGDARVTGVIDWGCALYGDFLYEVAYMSYWWPWYQQWREIDLIDEARRHYAGQVVDIAHFEERVAAYQIRTGLDGIVYTAWLGRASQLEWNVHRTLEIVDAS